MAADRPRLVVTIEGDEESLEVLAVAVRLAAGLERDLVGLFLEDQEALAAAALPRLRAVSMRGGHSVPLSAAAVRRAMRAQAERARRQMEASARQHRLRWSFEMLHSDLGAFGLGPGDLLASGPRTRQWGRPGPAAAPPPPCPTILIGRPHGPVLVLFEGGEESLEVGRRIAVAGGVPLVVLCVGGGINRADELAGQVRRRLAGMEGARLAVLIAESQDPAALASTIRAWRPAIVVADTCETDSRLRAAVAALTGARSRP